MSKKLLGIAALVAVLGTLVFGAVNITQAKWSSDITSIEESVNTVGNPESIPVVDESIAVNQESAAMTDQAVVSNPDNATTDVVNASVNPESLAVDQETGSLYPGYENYARGQGMGWKGSGQGGSGYGAGEMTGLPPASLDELSEAEIAALLYMREEEKLAHDVYVTLYAKWGLPLFNNISRSEQTHTEAVKALIDRYGLTDPNAGEVGVFTNTDLQKLYTDLVARGSQSLAEAIKVGAAIEEIDILDLQERLELIDNADLQQVFNNLLKGSYNHLQAFVKTLQTQTGETYQPQYLSVEAYQSIITAVTVGGAGYGAGQNGSNGQRGNGRP